ncbi:type I glyceraldehyde-3-phosphate dehydrogenase [Alcaligenes endophyticus]|uniref:Erythrose-4-phosphate dehydrogenase n=1 Tax=Alcaligenes endophyticus TaxID=1929088 RepID=A0ABT8EJK4_9BURK|nr:glyceraldehyde 3-phosphate dehydrogenase NAD-binding domain-containing protein [Alcaligenes endophyticus]MCX5591794.1 erythrose-4-phosphate dehydrogenase [Alcaligenes endophyticus]MDN4121471.1 erythrose-4-phosphate dehydrogenase [Alcaligenes endophyticus]
MTNQRALRVGINGYGRIGRCVLRAIYERYPQLNFELVAINELANIETMAYLTQYDSTHGVFPGEVSFDQEHLIVRGQSIKVLHQADPRLTPWGDLQLDLLLECSGAFSEREQLNRFIAAGCPRLLVSQPTRSAADVDYTVVASINEDGLQAEHTVVSNASCTTNAIVPVLAHLDRHIGIRHAFLTTLHSVMNDQPMLDGYHAQDLARTRSALQSMIPVATGLAQGVERLLPQLSGKVQAKSIRVPILNVSAIDLMVNLERDSSPTEINALFQQAAQRWPDVLAFSHRAHASIDFNHNPHSAIIDGTQTRTNGDGLLNMLVWFDNEWGFANRMLDTACAWAKRFV